MMKDIILAEIKSQIDELNARLRNPEQVTIPEKCIACTTTREDGKVSGLVSYYVGSKLRNEAARKTMKSNNTYTETEFENVPVSGFMISGYSGGGSKDIAKTYIYIVDPRGWDIPIALPQAMELIQSVGYTNQKFDKPMMYIWEPSGISLVGCTDEEYKQLLETRAAHVNVPKKQLVPGQLYYTKDGPVYYFGKILPFKVNRDMMGTHNRSSEQSLLPTHFAFERDTPKDLYYCMNTKYTSAIGPKDKVNVKFMYCPGAPKLTTKQVEIFRKAYINAVYMPDADDMYELPMPEDFISLEAVEDTPLNANPYYGNYVKVAVSPDRTHLFEINDNSPSRAECRYMVQIRDGQIYYVERYSGSDGPRWVDAKWLKQTKLPGYTIHDSAAGYYAGIDNTGKKFIFMYMHHNIHHMMSHVFNNILQNPS